MGRQQLSFKINPPSKFKKTILLVIGMTIGHLTTRLFAEPGLIYLIVASIIGFIWFVTLHFLYDLIVIGERGVIETLKEHQRNPKTKE